MKINITLDGNEYSERDGVDIQTIYNMISEAFYMIVQTKWPDAEVTVKVTDKFSANIDENIDIDKYLHVIHNICCFNVLDVFLKAYNNDRAKAFENLLSELKPYSEGAKKILVKRIYDAIPHVEIRKEAYVIRQTETEAYILSGLGKKVVLSFEFDNDRMIEWHQPIQRAFYQQMMIDLSKKYLEESIDVTGLVKVASFIKNSPEWEELRSF